MHINAMSIDAQTVVGPAWADVEAAIRSLDGDLRTVIVLTGDEATLTIGGGSEGHYLCSYAESDDVLYDLWRSVPTSSDDLVSLVTGHQEGYFEPNLIVGRDAALAAAKAFADSGHRMDSPDWHLR